MQSFWATLHQSELRCTLLSSKFPEFCLQCRSRSSFSLQCGSGSSYNKCGSKSAILVHGHDFDRSAQKVISLWPPEALTLSQGCEWILFRNGYSNLFPTFNVFYIFHTFQSPTSQFKRLGYVHTKWQYKFINTIKFRSEHSRGEQCLLQWGSRWSFPPRTSGIQASCLIYSIFFIVQRRGARERRFELVKCKS